MDSGNGLTSEICFIRFPNLVNAMYREAFHRIPIMIMARLNENMMINNVTTTETIISAKRDIGSPHIMALLRIFRYTSYFFIVLSLYNNSDEIGEDPDNRSRNQHKYQNPGNPFF